MIQIENVDTKWYLNVCYQDKTSVFFPTSDGIVLVFDLTSVRVRNVFCMYDIRKYDTYIN